MRETVPVIEESRVVEDVHHLGLIALLHELVREKGNRGAALGAAEALAAPRPHLRTVAQLGSVRALQHGSYLAAKWALTRREQCGLRWLETPSKAFHSLGCSGDNWSTFWLFPAFRA